MSNDRIFIVCNKCKGEKLLLRFYPGRCRLWEGTFEAQKWFQKHFDECHENGWGMNLGGEPVFHLTTESE